MKASHLRRLAVAIGDSANEKARNPRASQFQRGVCRHNWICGAARSLYCAVTGNFVTLGAALVFGAHGIIAKLVALPEFIVVVVVARVLDSVFRKNGLDALWLLLGLEVLLLIGFFVSAVMLGPFLDSDAPAALLVGFTVTAAMAIQNAVQRVHFSSIPPTTIMTANTTQAVLDAVDLWRGDPGSDRAVVKARLGRTIRGIT